VAEPPTSSAASEDDLAQKRAEAAGAEPQGEPAGEGVVEHDGNGNGGAPTGDGGGSGDGDFPGEDEGEQGPPPIAIEGDGQLNLQVGGAKPDKASVKLRGGSIDIPAGQLKKGDVVNLLVKVRVAEVHLVDKIDNSTGEITQTERRHVAKIMGVEKVAV
jgi:hypothetical protein